ncbi:MAG: signal peptidase I [Devosiaceae bacterium]|nr:signal peptidase I [Devosiaceae bacterium]
MSKTKPKSSKANSFVSEIMETIIIIVQALIIALVFRTFLFQPFFIPTASMQSSLMIGDYLMASKYTWGYGRYSFPLGIIPFNGRIFERIPNRGDIAVFRPVTEKDPYIKRLIGLPGDKIQVKEGRLYINEEITKREEIGTVQDKDSRGYIIPVTQYRETLPSGVSYIIQEISDEQRLDNTQEYIVPAGHYFMMGDNRDRSSDSRILSSVGYVPAGNLIGKAEVRFFSITDNIAPWKIWLWPKNVRLDRMFESVYQ